MFVEHQLKVFGLAKTVIIFALSLWIVPALTAQPSQQDVEDLVLLYQATYVDHWNKSIEESDNFISYVDSINTGIVRFEITTDTVYLYLNENYEQLITLTESKSLRLNTGYYKVFVFGKDIPEWETYLQVEQGETTSLYIPNPKKSKFEYSSTRAAYARIKWDANLIIETDELTSIWINDKPFGSELVVKNVPTGVYKIELQYNNGTRHTELVEIQQHRLTFLSKFFLPSEKNSKFYSFFPGVSQMYKQQYLKGGTAMVLSGLAIGLGLSNQSRYNSKKNEFNELYSKYLSISDENLALEYGNRLDEMKKTVNKYGIKRNIFFVATGVLYALNIYDGFQKPRMGYRRTNSIDPFNSLEVALSDRNLTVSLTVAF